MKKTLTLTADEFQVNDEIVEIGTVKAVGGQLRDHTTFAYENHRSELVATALSNTYAYEVEREVEEEEFRVRAHYIPDLFYVDFKNDSDQLIDVWAYGDDEHVSFTVDKADLKAVVEKL